ncbi:36313_t:CDS:1, partial [Gigaspora margarita]
ALPLGIIVMSDESEATFEKGINLLKVLLSHYAFFGRGPNIGPIVILTDDSHAEQNAIKKCWPQLRKLLCIFHVLQAFWHWLHNAKHNINKEHKSFIMDNMKRILYARTKSEMEEFYNELKTNYYSLYPQLQRHFELLWNRRQFWAVSFRTGLLLRGNNTNNYVERSFGLLKDI